jgi:hypothetical protein
MLIFIDDLSRGFSAIVAAGIEGEDFRRRTANHDYKPASSSFHAPTTHRPSAFDPGGQALPEFWLHRLTAPNSLGGD